MKNWTPKIGDRVGVKYHSADFSKKLASIETVERVSPTGIQVTLSNGRKYKITRGDYHELTDFNPSMICLIEKAEKLIANQTARQQQDEEAKAIYQQSPKAQRGRICSQAANDAIARIAEEGHGVDYEGRLDVLHDEIQASIERYLEIKLPDLTVDMAKRGESDSFTAQVIAASGDRIAVRVAPKRHEIVSRSAGGSEDYVIVGGLEEIPDEYCINIYAYRNLKKIESEDRD